MNAMTTEIPHTEFGDGFTVPQPILDFGFEDQSWHNDACPSYIMWQRDDQQAEARVELWVDHVDPEKREFPEWPRFRICVRIWDSYLTIFDGDSLDECIDQISSMRESLDELKALYSEFGRWHLDDYPGSVLWSGVNPDNASRVRMKNAITALNRVWSTESTAINAGAWIADALIAD